MTRHTTSFKVNNSGGSREYFTKLHQVFAEREKSIRKMVQTKHKEHIEFLSKRGINLESLRDSTNKRLAMGMLAGSIVLNPISATSQAVTVLHPTGQSTQIVSVEDTDYRLAQSLKTVVPAGYENLSTAQEQQVTVSVKQVVGVNAVPEIEGKRLNRSFGLIGAEQHLYRYPGDTVFDQLQTPSDTAMFSGSGIAPGLGAYGYFAPSKAALTQKDIEREKWYVVAQTFLAPGFKENSNATAQFFKYRKFIVINPDSGQAVVGDLADAGPGEYTGKSFGGSPEVMHALGYGGGSRKGRVVFYFLDDPKDQIPLGPISANLGGK